jgi:hypothetical protein
MPPATRSQDYLRDPRRPTDVRCRRRSSGRIGSWPAPTTPTSTTTRRPTRIDSRRSLKAYDVLSDPDSQAPLRRVRARLPSGAGGRRTRRRGARARAPVPPPERVPGLPDGERAGARAGRLGREASHRHRWKPGDFPGDQGFWTSGDEFDQEGPVRRSVLPASQRRGRGTRSRRRPGGRGRDRGPREAYSGTRRSISISRSGRAERTLDVHDPGGGHRRSAHPASWGRAPTGSDGGAAGDLYLVVRIAPHPRYRSRDATSTPTSRSPVEAALGGGRPRRHPGRRPR